MPAYTPAQVQAIASQDRPLQIIACAGSGKTQVISQRIAELLRRPDVAPANIVAFTFTEKAAAELKERVLGIVGADGGDTTGLAEMFIGTMHAFCLDLLQTYVPETFKFSVLTEITQRLLIDRNSKRSGLTVTPAVVQGQTKYLRRYVNSRLYAQVLSVLAEDDVDEALVPDKVLESQFLYKSLLAQHAYFDYTSMLEVAVELLEVDQDDEQAAALLAHVRDTVRFVVVDEYQDVNPLQERLVDALIRFGANLCVVGDDDQTIYQWRGSAVSNILTFADRYDDVEQVTLADNFRSTAGVIAVGRMVAESIPAGHRLAKQMQHASHQQWQRGDILALDHSTQEDEAAAVCDRIEALRGIPFVDSPGSDPRGLSWSDCAVLLRSVARDAGPIVDELDRRGIPYVVKGLSRLFDAPSVQAAKAMFQYVVDSTFTADDLRAAWESSRLLEPGTDLTPLLRVLDAGSDFERGERWGTYNIQRLYLDALEALKIREDTIPGDPVHAELAFYQLGKFSQVISDFEEINFSSSPAQKYQSFVDWLTHQAPDYYDDSDADVGYAQPDAVVISTVHQAKGMQWPAVFVPCLRRNRFPGKRQGGLNLFHVIPQAAVTDADRYKGTEEDERRLFYVAVTRAQKYLTMSFSPGASSMYRNPSVFMQEVRSVAHVSTAEARVLEGVSRIAPQPKVETPQVTLSFSELKYLFDCRYQFKLRFLYGFNPPIHEALGFGKGLHDALAEMHKRALTDDLVGHDDVDGLVNRHLHTPYAYPALREQLEKSARKSLDRYLDRNGDDLPRTLHSEKQVQVHVAPGITVDGRIDLIKRLETDEVSIVDFKSTDRAQPEDVTRDQLHVYAVGYQELTGENADLVEILNLDEDGKSVREGVEGSLLDDITEKIRDAGEALRSNGLPRLPVWCDTCAKCDLVALCRDRPSV
ncbi:ATP-dependent DNA helicase [Isoptericola sp. 178]|uniref:ATP-dependent helicase n=1 Tax=Isoptericola sp. 178 TaxID=3064651 RepID=UPI00271375C4|nr:ATP-dependent DNA helicase [Isoptericola sp. 178]MDO8144521.1 ATP-dependent DNA helicase [Isoptericola sp. 178]